MSLYIGREASKIWKRLCAEVTTEIILLAENWKFLLAGLIFQYIHGLAAHGVHYFHRPGQTLQDVGYFLLPELGQDRAYISEFVFSFVFLSFVLWTFHPFIFKSKKIYTVLVWCRVLAFLVACQMLRIVTFYSTQLPGPNYHCREGSKLARLPRPDSALEVLLINFPRAWYTVNLVVYFIDHKLPELPDRTAGALLLPINKDSRTKEENHKLLNGNSGDPVDRRLRTPMNGKIMDDNNIVYLDTAMNEA